MSWKSIFRISLLLCVGVFGGYVVLEFILIGGMLSGLGVQGIRTDIEFLQQQIQQKNILLQQAMTQPGYAKWQAVKQLEESTHTMLWSEHIPKVLTMLDDIQRVDSTEGEAIILSDFSVDLQTIRLKGRVSNLLLLYWTSPERNFTGLFDRFVGLDFVDNIRAQTYDTTKTNDTGAFTDKFFEFVLQADVQPDARQAQDYYDFVLDFSKQKNG